MILITGGYDLYGLSSVEVLTSDGSNLPCAVPPLPTSRYWHTQDGLVACGGYNGMGDTATRKSCTTLTAAGWTTSHQLQTERGWHVSWSSAAGLMLMGGVDTGSVNTADLLPITRFHNGPSTSYYFKLDYETG